MENIQKYLDQIYKNHSGHREFLTTEFKESRDSQSIDQWISNKVVRSQYEALLNSLK